MMVVRLAAVVLLPALAACQSAPVHSYRVVATYPHDRSAYTQGLQFVDGVLYEGTGLNGRSTIRVVDLATGKVSRMQPISDMYFGEGITVLNGRLFQLTWQHGLGFVYDPKTFQQKSTFRYPGEGWGLTTDGKQLIMSDGSAQLRFLNPDTQAEIRRVQVRDGYSPVMQLNELEFIDGEVWANVYTTHRVVRIDPASGRVKSWVDFTGLLPPSDYAGGAEVLNGIAYDAKGKRIFVTGKLWPKLFQVQVVEKKQ
jgi:glutamine cyclotransferase